VPDGSPTTAAGAGDGATLAGMPISAPQKKLKNQNFVLAFVGGMWYLTPHLKKGVFVYDIKNL
jgi:hypothetical protein